MEISVKAKVYCVEGCLGRSTCAIVDPTTRRVTHLVVRPRGTLYVERLVPMMMIAEATRGSTRLRCARDEVARMEPFIEIKSIEVDPYDHYLWLGERLTDECPLHPRFVWLPHRCIPAGGVVIDQSTRIKAANGIVGRMDQFVVDSTDGYITHLVLRRGPLWRQQNVTIAAAQIESVGEDAVCLKLDQGSVEALPTVPVLAVVPVLYNRSG